MNGNNFLSIILGKTCNVSQNQGDSLTGKSSEAQPQHSSSSTAYHKSSSMSDTSSVSKPSLSSSDSSSTFPKSISHSEPSSTAGSSKCSSQTTTSSPQLSFEETSKNNSQPGARGMTI